MPLYSISTPDALSYEANNALANVITTIHCQLTGAPETFVNVVYHQNVPLRRDVAVHILANVRKGRTAAVNAELRDTLVEQVARFVGVEQSAVEIDLYEMPSRWVMEGGEILPEPGQEDQCAWLKAELE